MHEIRSHVLKKLALSKHARYSDLKPKTVDGNRFVYHLKVLIEEGLVSVKDKTYSLTGAGKRLVDRMSFDTLGERIQPKIVTIIILERGKKQLLFRKSWAPFSDHVSFPYGKIHLEERIGQAAARELLEKSGFKAKLKHRGDVYLTIHDDAELLTHMLCHVFTGTGIVGEIRKDYPGGQCFWGDINEIPRDKVLPGARQMLDLVRKNRTRHFFAEYSLNAINDFDSN